jgi:hypothetical protein
MVKNPDQLKRVSGLVMTVTILAMLVLLPMAGQFSFASATTSIKNAFYPSTISYSEPELMQKLQNAHKILTDMMIHYQNKDIPVFLSGVNQTFMGLDVGINDHAPLTIDAYHDKLVALLGDIPMHIFFSHFVLDSCSGQQSVCSPLIGGIEATSPLEPPGDAGGNHGTLNSAVINSGGSQGFIMSGHVADYSCSGTTGQTIYQPGESGNTIGTVLINPVMHNVNTYADAAYVSLGSGVSANPTIYPGNYYIAREISDSEVPIGTSIYMEGSYTGQSQNSVLYKGYTVQDQDPIYCTGTLVDQDLSNYASTGGDSGAPIFSLEFSTRWSFDIC